MLGRWCAPNLPIHRINRINPDVADYCYIRHNAYNHNIMYPLLQCIRLILELRAQNLVYKTILFQHKYITDIDNNIHLLFNMRISLIPYLNIHSLP